MSAEDDRRPDVPESRLRSPGDVPESRSRSPGDVPESRLPGGVPESRSPGGVPGSRSPGDVPESRSPGDVPESRSRPDVPESRSRPDVPESRLRSRGASPEPSPVEPRGMDRRALLRVGVTTAMAAGTVALGLALHDRAGREKTRTLPRIKDHRVAKPAGANDMAIARGPDPAANVRRAIEALGGMGRFVRPGEKVVVKPNIGWNRLPEQAANTNPEVVAEVVRLVVAAGAGKVWMTDVSVNTPEQCFMRSGIEKSAAAAGAQVVRPAATAFREVEVAGKLLQTGEVLFPFVEADRVINLPIVKQHSLSGATMALKNWYGVLGGQRVKLHQNIHLSIVDLALMMKPTLTVLDATRILLANGPTGGSLADVKRLDTVAAGTDEVALDAFGATLLALRPTEVGFIVEGMKAGLGTPDWRSLKLVELGS